MKSNILLTIFVAAISFCGICIMSALLNPGSYTVEGIFGVVMAIAIVKIYRIKRWFEYIDDNTPDTP